MSGFVWFKTVCDARTSGFFAFRGRDGTLCTSDGTALHPPSDSVVIQGGELLTAINKSAPKGMYVSDWHVADWIGYFHASNASEEDWEAYATVKHAIESIDGTSGITSPRHAPWDVVAEKKAGAKAKKDKIELEFKESIVATLQQLKTMTSNLVHRYYRKWTEQSKMNTQFMVENRLTRIIFPKYDMCDNMTQIWPTDDEWSEYLRLTTKLNLAPLTDMQTDMCQHYVMKKNTKVIAGVSIMTANINNCNKSICASVELLVSSQKGSAKMFHKIISANLKKRAGTSYMVTQALDSNKANEFWLKHMARHREADALTFMFYMIDHRYHLCEDVTNLRATF